MTATLPNDDELQALDGRALSPDECRRLAWLAKQASSDHAIVEIGSYRGKSTCFLAAGAQAGNGATVYAIDLWDLGRDKLLNTKTVFTEFQEQVASVGLTDYVVPMRGDSLTLAQFWDNPIGLLWIDGAHDERSVRADYEAWSPFVAPGGWIAFHDYGTKSWPGVKAAVEGLVVASGLWEGYSLQRTIWSARRRV